MSNYVSPPPPELFQVHWTLRTKFTKQTSIQLRTRLTALYSRAPQNSQTVHIHALGPQIDPLDFHRSLCGKITL